MNKILVVLSIIFVIGCVNYDISVNVEETIIGNHASIFSIGNPVTDEPGCSAWLATAKSGTIVTVTNSHCADMADDDGNMTAFMDTGLKHNIKLLYNSPISDIAIFTAPDDNSLRPLVLAARPVDRFDVVYSFGYPLVVGQVLSKGRVIKYDFTDVQSHTEIENCTQPKHLIKFHKVTIPMIGTITIKACVTHLYSMYISARIFPGNSGSPLFNDRAEIVGLVYAGIRESAYGIVIPLDDIRIALGQF